MALIEKFVVVANHYGVKAGEEIIEGMCVKLDANGEAELANGGSDEICIGVAGDTKSTSTAGLPSTNDALVGAPAQSSQFVNRVSDTFDETKSSGRITVYQSGGTFATNQYEGTPAVNDELYVSGNGKLTASTSTSGQVVAVCTRAAGAYDSGVPGIDVNGSITLGNYIEFKLLVLRRPPLGVVSTDESPRWTETDKETRTRGEGDLRKQAPALRRIPDV
jgi:hypothetical protein